MPGWARKGRFLADFFTWGKGVGKIVNMTVEKELEVGDYLAIGGSDGG